MSFNLIYLKNSAILSHPKNISIQALLKKNVQKYATEKPHIAKTSKNYFPCFQV